MNRGMATPKRLTCLLAGLLLAWPAIVDSAPRRDSALEAQLRAHINVLASDDYEGREPGTEGEAKTLRYLGQQWFDIGLVSGTNNPGSDWFVPVTLVAREPATSVAQFFRKGRRVTLTEAEGVMLTSGQRSLVRNAPVLFVGKAAEMPGATNLPVAWPCCSTAGPTPANVRMLCSRPEHRRC